MFLRALAALARSPLAGFLVSRMFASLSFAIPVKRLRETQTLMAFHHPRPSSPLHILIVPKKALGGLGDIGSAEAQFLQDLFHIVQSLVAEYRLEETGYRLIANGGKYQDVPQLHFHLVAGTNEDSRG